MKNRDIGILAGLFFLSALLFTETTTSLTIGLITFLAYWVFYKRNKKVILLLVSCVISFALLETVGRMLELRDAELVYNMENDHRMKPHWNPDINGDGIRCPVEADDFTADTFNIICLGDSFTYGKGLDASEDSMPSRLEAMANELDPPQRVRTVNFGWVSSSPLLSRRLLEDIGHNYKPDLVLLFVDMTDFHDDIKYLHEDNPIGNSPSVMLLYRLGMLDHYLQLRDRWRVHRVARRLFGIEITVPEDRFFIINQPLEDSLPWLADIETNIADIATYCEQELGIPFAMVLLPRYIQYNREESPKNWERALYTPLGPHVFEPFEWLKLYREKVSFPCYSLLETFQQTSVFPTCFRDDPHWNPAGCRVAAKGVIGFLQGGGLLPKKDVSTSSPPGDGAADRGNIDAVFPNPTHDNPPEVSP